MNIINILIKLRNDIKEWTTNNILALRTIINEEISDLKSKINELEEKINELENK